MTTYCTNLRTEEMTEYQDFDFLAFGRLGAQVYGLKADGLYALGGETDAGTRISASATTHKNSLDNASPGGSISVHTKRAYTMYFEAGSDPVVVVPYVDDTKVGAFYGSDRVKLARGARGRYWAFKFANVGGDDLRVEAVEVLIEILRRKK